jgi:hypothetical protein
MIIVELMGGLGNQMFQYALGRHLSLMNKTSLKLDLTRLEERAPGNNYVLRNYELDKYHHNAQVVEKNELAYFIPVRSFTSKVLYRVKERLGLVSIKHEAGFEFQPEILMSGKNTYLSGYWQSEKYFSSISETIRNDFAIKKSLLSDISNLETFRNILLKMSQTNSVSVHFRRGDYVSNPLIEEKYGTYSPAYYQKAISLIKSKIEQPHFFLFSDEPGWLKSNIEFKDPFTIIEGYQGYIDMFLMSQCKHNIIANSSFSWWGAWLNDNHAKTVIAPLKWFVSDDENNQTKDLIPEEWERI